MRCGISAVIVVMALQVAVAERSSAGERPIWESSYTKAAPQVDGQVDEIWSKAKPLTVTVREALGGGGPREVVLRSLHTDGDLFVLAEWPDPTRSDMRDPYVWNKEKAVYERPQRPDDQFALEFPMLGDFTVNMLAQTQDYTADVWHWKAGRGNPVGWVDDKRHFISHQPSEGAKKYSMGGHADIYISRIMDTGEPSYVVKSRPASYEGDVVGSFISQQPTASLADVRGKGVHNVTGWTLEMSRAFDTGHPDDAVIDPASGTRCGIAVLDDELYWDHSVSQEIILRFHEGASSK